MASLPIGIPSSRSSYHRAAAVLTLSALTSFNVLQRLTIHGYDNMMQVVMNRITYVSAFSLQSENMLCNN